MTVTANLRALGAILPFGRGDGSRLLFSGWNRAPLSPIVWDRINWQGTQQLYSTARTIINTYSEPLLADFATKSGTLLQGNLNDIGGLTKGGTFPAAVQQDYAYWSIPTLAATTQYTVSVFVKMADSSAPVPSLSATTGDFLLSLSSAWMATGTWTVTPLGSGVYRCIWVGTSGAVASLYGGILRTATHSGRGFTVTGFNIQAGSVSGAYIPTTGSAVTVTDYTGTNPITLAQTTNPAVNQLVATNNGKGDGTTTAFTVTPSGTTPTVTALYKTDWQGRQLLYSTARTNYCPRSQDFNFWTPVSGVSLLADTTTAPDGTLTADTLAATGGLIGYGAIVMTVASGTALKVKCWVKNIDSTQSTIYVRTAVDAGKISISWNGATISNVSATVGGSNAQFVAYPNGWYLVSFDCTTSELNQTLRIYPDAFTTNKSIYAWGFSASPQDGGYIKTDATAVTITDYTLATNTATLSPAPAVGSLISWDGSYVGGLGVDEFVARQLIDQLGKVI